MAGYQDIFNQYLGVEANTLPKQDEVANAADTKKAQLETIQMERDRARLNPIDFALRYGQARNENPVVPQNRDGRDGWQQTGDALNAVASGFVNSTVGLAGLAAGLIDADAGVAVSNTLQNFNRNIERNYSDELQTARSQNQARNERDRKVNQERYSSDVRTDGNTLAVLKRLGRDTYDAVGNALADPRTAGDLVANGIGSLLSVAPVATGVKAVGAKALETAVKTGVVTEGGRVAAKLAEIGKAAVTPTVIGLQEGGGAYTGATSEALERLNARTDITQDQKNEIANRAGLTAAGIQAPVSAVIGRVLGTKAEELTLGSKGIGREILKEGTEEYIQSGLGQVSQNVALKQEVTPDQDLLDQVGSSAGEGLIGGAGAAGVTQTGAAIAQVPGLALRGTVEAGKLGVRGVRAVGEVAGAAANVVAAGAKTVGQPIYDAIVARGERIRAENERASPVSEDVIYAGFEAATAEAPEVSEAIKTAVAENAKTPEEAAAGTEFVDRLVNAVAFDPTEFEDGDTTPLVQSVVSDAKNKFDAMYRLAEVINLREDDSMDQMSASVKLYNMLSDVEDLLNSDPDGINNIPADHPANQMINDYTAVLSNISQTPKILRAVRNMQVLAEQMASQIKPVQDTELDTPAGAQMVENTIGVAQLAPNKIDAQAAEQVLYHAENGRIALAPKQKIALQSAVAIVRAQQAFNEEADRQGLRPEDYVTKEVLAGDNGTTFRKSALTHMKDVTNAYRSGDLELAKAYLLDFGKFAQMMQNKVEALNSHLASGSKRGVHFQTLNARRQFERSIKPLFVHTSKENSITLAQRIGNEAKTVAQIVNDLTGIFPDLGVSPIALVPLDARLNGKASDVVKAFSQPTVEEENTQNNDVGNNSDANLLPANERAPEMTVSEYVDRYISGEGRDDLDMQQFAANNASEIEKEFQARKSREEETTAEVEAEAETVDEPQAQEAVEAEAESETVVSDEVIADPVPEPKAEPKKKGIEAIFPAMASEWFKKTFKLPAVARTRTIGTEAPVSFVSDAMRSENNLRAVIGDAGMGYTGDLQKAYSDYLKNAPKLISIMENRLKDFMSSPYSRKDPSPKSDHFNKLISFARGKALVIVEENQQYNTELLEGAVLAGMQWLLSSAQYGQTLTDEDVMKIYEVDQLDPDTTARLNAGMSLSEAKRSLASKISTYWGLSKSDDAPLNFAEGVPEAIAAELLEAMVQNGDIEVDSLQIGQKTPDVYIPKALSEDNAINAFPDAIERVVVLEPEPVYYIGETPKRVAETQLRNASVPLTDSQKAAIKFEQGVKHYVNIPMMKLYASLGIDNLLKIFGGGDITDSMNKNHRKSLEGKHLTIRSAYRSIADLMQMVERQTALTGLESDDVPIHYDYGFTRVNRMQMLGKNNPQANKLMREAVLPTRSTLDLSSKNSDAYRSFALGLAQALGIKVHNMTLDASIEQLDKYLTDKADLVEILSDTDKTFTDEQVNTICDAGLTEAGLMALVEYGRYLRTNNKNEFRTSLYVEADGVTNGPVNAMALMTPGQFSAKWLKNMAKGGLFIGSPNRTMNEHRSGIDPEDMYQDTTNNLIGSIGSIRQEILGNSELNNQMDAMLKLMSMFFPDLIFDNGQLTLKRGITKNPLTITLYGSGAEGIAGNVTDQLISAIYEEMTNKTAGRDSLVDDPEFLRNFNLLTENVVSRTKDGELSFSPVGSKNRTVNADDFTITTEEKTNIRKNILHLFIAPMREAIDETVGRDLMETVNVLRKGVQVQSIFYQYEYQREVAEALEAKEDKNEFLSQREIAAIQEKLAPIAPLYETGEQNLLVSGNEKVDVGAKQFGNSLSDTKRTDAFVFAPSDAGVAGIPFFTIAMGDGRMMQILSANTELDRTLKIFDGMNLPLDQLELGSRAANEAVWNTWQGNPIREVLKGYSRFMDNIPKTITPAQKDALTKSLFDPTRWKEGVSAGAIKAEMELILSQLESMADQIDARHRALARVQVSVDQMAAAGAPYQNDGVSLVGLDEAELLKKLNELYLEELNGAPEVSEDISDNLPKVGRVHKSGARVLSFTALRNLVREFNIPVDQRALYGDILRSLTTKGYKIVFGSKDQIDGYALATGRTVPAWGAGAQGATVVADQTIYLLNPSSETLLHELIHAATFDKIEAHYEGNSNPEVAEAVERIEALMQQFLSFGSDINASAREAYNSARAAILSALNQGQKAVALNEFMAWGLSNQGLIEKEKATEATGIGKLVRDVVDAIKRLVFGRKKVEKPGNDIFSNLRFNTNIVMRAQPNIAQEFKSTTLFQNMVYGTDQRLVEINDAFSKSVVNYLRSGEKIDEDKRNFEVVQALLLSGRVAKSVQAHGFPMTMQEATTFEMIVAAMATEAQIDPNALNRIQDLYVHVTKNLKVEDFMSDPDSLDPADRFYAQERYDAVMGNYLTEVDGAGRSTLLPVFYGLVTVNDTFRNAIANMPVPKTEKGDSKDLDTLLRNAGATVMDSLAAHVSGEGTSKNMAGAIDALTDHILMTIEDRQSFMDQIARPTGGVIDKANDIITDMLEAASDKGLVLGEKLNQAGNTEAQKAVGSMIKLLSGVVSEKNGKIVSESAMSALNRADFFKPFFDLVNDLIGRTGSNADVYDMIKQVRSYVSQMRQQYREHLPQVLNSKFVQKLTSTQWTQLHAGLGKTDIASLTGVYTNQQIIDMLADPTKIDTLINDLETEIKEIDPRNWGSIQRKARQLAKFMNTGIPGTNLLRNAFAVTNLFGEGARSRKVTQQTIDMVDKLVTLYAYETLPAGTKDGIASLAQDEVEGIDFLISYLTGQRAEELRKQQTGMSQANGYKGYVPTENQETVTLIVASDAEFNKLAEKSMIRVGNYNGSNIDRRKGSYGYYFSPVRGRALYNQGILQNVRLTSSGVDLATGFTYSTMTAGRITDPQLVQRIERNASNEQDTNEPLLPVYDKSGTVVAYERSIDPMQLGRLNQNTNLAQLIGMWRGRQVEEINAEKFNQALIKNLHTMYVNDTKDPAAKAEYIDIFDKRELKKDPVLQDAINLITPETLAYIESVFGDNFYVRRDMLNDAFGYRDPSLGDFFTGNSRWSPETQDRVKNLAIGAFGYKAYEYMIKAEGLLQNAVAEAKVMIVVKSVVVPMSNLIANIYQLIGRGVPFANIIRGMPKKTVEIDNYVKARVRQISLEAELRANEKNVVKARQIENEIQSINDNFRRMSIWPLIEAGEFTSISDSEISFDDEALTKGRLTEWFEAQVDKMPGPLRTAGKYALITRDTALFHGMQKAVEYGDFLAKSILYDDLTKRSNMGKKDALARITEEFVNYDRLSGRFRTALEKNGLLWFWNFKIRSAKIAVSMIRNNPVHTLLAGLAPEPSLFGSVGMPTEDNIFAKLGDGSLDYSMGPGQGFRSMGLSPWLNLTT